MRKVKIHTSFFSTEKRLIDVLIALILLVGFIPFGFILVPILRFLIGKPVFFKQQRTGKGGQTFTIYKIRRMVKNADLLKHFYWEQNQAPWPMFKMNPDPRSIVKTVSLPWGKKCSLDIGDFLSQSGIDEIPQLLNILRGEMSFFGPRPLPIKEAAQLKKLDPSWWTWRHQVTPGIFSVWAAHKTDYQTLRDWKKLEGKTVTLSLVQQFQLIGSICIKQISQFFPWKFLSKSPSNNQ